MPDNPVSIAGRFWPRLAVLLGAAGVLLCIAAAAGIWIGVARINHAASTAAIRAETALMQLSDGTAAGEALVREARRIVEEIKTSAKQRTAERIEDLTDDLKPDLDLRGLGVLIARLTETIEALGKAVSGISLIAEASQDIGLSIELSELRESEKRLERVSSGLRGLTSRIESAGQRRRQTVEQRAEDAAGWAIESLCDQATPLLEEIDPTLRLFAETTERLNRQLTEARERLRRGLRLAAVAVTLLALWMGAGQVQLLRSGLNDPNSDQTPASGDPGSEASTKIAETV